MPSPTHPCAHAPDPATATPCQVLADPSSGRVRALHCDMAFASTSLRAVVRGRGPVGSFTVTICGINMTGGVGGGGGGRGVLAGWCEGAWCGGAHALGYVLGYALGYEVGLGLALRAVRAGVAGSAAQAPGGLRGAGCQGAVAVAVLTPLAAARRRRADIAVPSLLPSLPACLPPCSLSSGRMQLLPLPQLRAILFSFREAPGMDVQLSIQVEGERRRAGGRGGQAGEGG